MTAIKIMLAIGFACIALPLFSYLCQRAVRKMSKTCLPDRELHALTKEDLQKWSAKDLKKMSGYTLKREKQISSYSFDAVKKWRRLRRKVKEALRLKRLQK
jgi:hypothetical protein